MHIFLCLLLGESHLWGQQWGDCCHVKDIHEKASASLGHQLLLAVSHQPCAGGWADGERASPCHTVWTEPGIWTAPGPLWSKVTMTQPSSSEGDSLSSPAEGQSPWGCHLTTHSHLSLRRLKPSPVSPNCTQRFLIVNRREQQTLPSCYSRNTEDCKEVTWLQLSFDSKWRWND